MSYPIETGRSWEEKQNLPRLQHGPPWISSQVIGLQIRSLPPPLLSHPTLCIPIFLHRAFLSSANRRQYELNI
ncbi:hypothetical protein ILYODFUR_020525 [Ilyodon furcidens]|uniref:Uncharacterized protein n=1 Tax=Ilyodon furcidens TaxID=33524 RepID=A0ABV0UB63_9TELE